jgi:hypothetical protein
LKLFKFEVAVIEQKIKQFLYKNREDWRLARPSRAAWASPASILGAG